MVCNGLRLEDTVNQLFHDDAVDFVSLYGARAQIFQPASFDSFRVNAALDKPARADQAQPPEPARRGFSDDYLRDIEQRQRRARADLWKRLMEGVVRADQEVGPNFLEPCC